MIIQILAIFQDFVDFCLFSDYESVFFLPLFFVTFALSGLFLVIFSVAFCVFVLLFFFCLFPVFFYSVVVLSFFRAFLLFSMCFRVFVRADLSAQKSSVGVE